MRVQIKKWGNSAAVRIPASVLGAAGLAADDAVDVREDDGRIIIEPTRRPAYDLSHMLESITPQNTHAEVDYGPATGKESL